MQIITDHIERVTFDHAEGVEPEHDYSEDNDYSFGMQSMLRIQAFVFPMISILAVGVCL